MINSAVSSLFAALWQFFYLLYIGIAMANVATLGIKVIVDWNKSLLVMASLSLTVIIVLNYLCEHLAKRQGVM